MIPEARALWAKALKGWLLTLPIVTVVIATRSYNGIKSKRLTVPAIGPEKLRFGSDTARISIGAH
jgi:hypothetical protein